MLARRLLLTLATAAALIVPALAQDFPITIEHEMGSVTIEEAPQRVVSIGYHEQDFLYALGVAPVGVRNWWGEHPYATWPWADAARQALGAEPEVMPGDEPNLEWILAQEPDLIVAIYLPMTDELYASLSQIAPVIATPKGYPLWGATWQAELTLIDQATSGNTERSTAIVADLDQRIAAAKAKYPQIVGKTGTNVYFESGGFVAWGSNDLASQFLSQFGLLFPAELDAMADEGNRIDISAENMRLIDLDVVVWPIDDPANGQQATIEAMPLYQNLNLSKEGRSVWLDDGSGLAYAAMSFQTPLALGYLIDILPPALAAAVDGDVATAPVVPKAD